jgi:hypothetical protein
LYTLQAEKARPPIAAPSTADLRVILVRSTTSGSNAMMEPEARAMSAAFQGNVFVTAATPTIINPLLARKSRAARLAIVRGSVSTAAITSEVVVGCVVVVVSPLVGRVGPGEEEGNETQPDSSSNNVLK